MFMLLLTYSTHVSDGYGCNEEERESKKKFTIK
jgi:hypothetical protein